MSKSITRFGANPPAPETGAPARILSGSPTTTLQNYYSDATGQFFAGIWESTPGKWQVNYTEDELCVILQGRLVLTDADGKAESFATGDAFVIPKGFTGSWETIETVRKYYAIFEAKG